MQIQPLFLSTTCFGTCFTYYRRVPPFHCNTTDSLHCKCSKADSLTAYTKQKCVDIAVRYLTRRWFQFFNCSFLSKIFFFRKSFITLESITPKKNIRARYIANDNLRLILSKYFLFSTKQKQNGSMKVFFENTKTFMKKFTCLRKKLLIFPQLVVSFKSLF